MAKIVRENLGELSQIKLGPVTIPGPVKIRISGRFIPAFTIDLSKPATPSEKVSVIGILKPKVQLLLGNLAYEMDYVDRKIKPIDPEVFEKDTFIDTISRLGIIPTIAIVAGTAILVSKLLRR